MKRRKLLFASLSLLLVTSCSFIVTKSFSWALYANDSYAINLMSKKIEQYPLDFDEQGYEKNKTDLENSIINQDRITNVYSLYNKFDKYARQLISRYFVSMALYSGDPSKEIYNQKRVYFLDKFYDYRNEYSNIRILASRSSDDIKNMFFKTTDPEEIKKQISEDEKSEQINELEAKLVEIENEMEILSSEKTSKDLYIDKSIDLYLKYIPIANELADLCGYDNYLDYAYDSSFSRDYKPSEGLILTDYVKEYIIPTYLEYKPTKGEGFDQRLYNIISSYNIANRGSNIGELLTSYTESLSGDLLYLYNTLWNNGYYYLSANESLGTAFTVLLYEDQSYMVFFGNNYQNAFTISHELGHYQALSINNKNTDKPLDIKETHSQSNEFLFMNYLKNKDLGDTYSYLFSYNLSNSLLRIINFSYIIEIENYAFTTPIEELNKDSFKEKLTELRDEYSNVISESYWCYPCVSSSCYYISYLTSLMASLEMFIKDFGTAKNNYLNLINDKDHFKCVECWENAGFTSPFNEEAYINIKNYLVGNN